MIANVKRIAAHGILPLFFLSDVYAQCPEAFLTQVPQEQASAGGIFFQKTEANVASWAPLEESGFSIRGDALKLIYVPSSDLCASREDSALPPECGEHGFLLVKVQRVVPGQANTEKVLLEHGTAFSAITGFAGGSVDTDLYQQFHQEKRSPWHDVIRNWHVAVPGRDTSHDTTFEPFEKKVQFGFTDEEVSAGSRVARLFRFETPQAPSIVCVPFDLKFQKRASMHLYLMLVEPTFSDDDFAPTMFTLTNN